MKKEIIIPKKVLIIEEKGSTLEFLSQFITHGQKEVRTAESGEDAFKILENGFMPDCIILAINLSKMNGSDILLKLRMDNRWETIPVLPFYRSALNASSIAV